jgi:hypothetical protein
MTKKEGMSLEIAKAPNIYAILPHVRCGFELECQRMDGKTMRDIEKQYSRQSYRSEELAREAIDKVDSTEKLIALLDAMQSNYSSSQCHLGRYSRHFIGVIPSNEILREHMFMEALTKECRSKKSVAQEALKRYMEHAHVTFSRHVYPTDAIYRLFKIKVSTQERRVNWENFCSKTLEIPSSCNMSGDGSVSGPEIRTVGGLTVQEFCRAVNELFEKHSFLIDERCSFHIHLSVNDVSHRYGERFQSWMLEYLFMNMTSMPESVVSRFCYYECRGDELLEIDEGDDDDDPYPDEEGEKYWMDQYFPFAITENRYAFVSYRGQTWEFRCFGNVQDPREAKRCLLLAIGALKYAYECSKGISVPYLHSGPVWKRTNSKLREYVKGKIKRKTAMAKLIKESAEVRRAKKRSAA